MQNYFVENIHFVKPDPIDVRRILKNTTKENWNEYLGCKDRFERKYITMQEFEEEVRNFTNDEDDKREKQN